MTSSKAPNSRDDEMPVSLSAYGQREWHVTEPYPSDFTQHYTHRNHVLRQFFWSRNITATAYADAFIDGTLLNTNDPFLMKDMTKAVLHILEAFNNRETILIFGDYDADGITSTTLLSEGMMALAPLHNTKASTIHWYIPSREEGYGLSAESLAQIKANMPDLTLVITVDNGIKAADAAQFAADHGIDMIVTDHHTVGEGFPTAAYAVINPQQTDCTYPEPGLAGCGVAYKLLQGLSYYTAKYLSASEYIDFADNWADLVAIGTVADVMSLWSLENRYLVKKGLNLIRTNPRIGIKALCESKQWGSTTVDWKSLNITDIGFRLAPCINAAGRIAHPKQAVDLLKCSDPLEATQLASNLINLNKERKVIQSRFIRTLQETLKDKDTSIEAMPIIVEHVENCSTGLAGLLAGDVVRTYNRPAIVLIDNKRLTDANSDETQTTAVLTASARSVEGVDIHQLLHECEDLLISFGGHMMAAGLSIYASNVDELRDRLYAVSREYMANQRSVKSTDLSSQSIPSDQFDRDSIDPLEPAIQTFQALDLDMELELGDIGYGLYQSLNVLEPYGSQVIPAMSFCSRRVMLVDCSIMGKDKRYLKGVVTDGRGNTFDMVSWAWIDQAGSHLSDDELEMYFEWLKERPIDIGYTIEMATWQGRTGLRLNLLDMRPSSDFENQTSQSVETEDKTYGTEDPVVMVVDTVHFDLKEVKKRLSSGLTRL